MSGKGSKVKRIARRRDAKRAGHSVKCAHRARERFLASGQRMQGCFCSKGGNLYL